MDISCGRKGKACGDVRQQQKRHRYNGGDKGKAGIATPACCFFCTVFTASEVLCRFEFAFPKSSRLSCRSTFTYACWCRFLLHPRPRIPRRDRKRYYHHFSQGLRATSYTAASSTPRVNAVVSNDCVFFFPTRAGVYFFSQMKTRNVFDRTCICPFSRLIICCM